MSKKSEIKELAEVMSLLTECSHCKQKINSKAPFCQYCGTKQIIQKSKKQYFCIHCGKEIGANSVFCSFCGKNQKDVENIPTLTKENKKKIHKDITLKCEKCSSENISIQIIQEKEETGCGTVILIILSFFVHLIAGIFILLLVILFSALKQPITKKLCICQKCGHTWKIR